MTEAARLDSLLRDVGKLLALAESGEIQRRDLNIELHRIKHDANNHRQVTDGNSVKLDLLENRIKVLSDGLVELKSSVDPLIKDRNKRIAGWGVIVSLGGIVMLLVTPLYNVLGLKIYTYISDLWGVQVNDLVQQALSVNVSALEQEALQALGLVVLGFVIFCLKRASAWIATKTSSDNMVIVSAIQTNLEKAAEAGLQFGIARSLDLIHAKGWDHVEVKNQVVSEAAGYMMEKFTPAMKAAGIDVNDPVATEQAIAGLLERKFPGVVAQASASPATPPVPEKATLAVAETPKTGV